MSGLKSRLARLERTVKAATGCPACKGEGYPSTVLDIQGMPPNPSPGCYKCGKARPGLRIVMCGPARAAAAAP